MSVTDLAALKIHGYVFDSDSFSDGGNSDFDDEYYALKPPAFSIETLQDRIVVILPMNQQDTVNKTNEHGYNSKRALNTNQESVYDAAKGSGKKPAVILDVSDHNIKGIQEYNNQTWVNNSKERSNGIKSKYYKNTIGPQQKQTEAWDFNNIKPFPLPHTISSVSEQLNTKCLNQDRASTSRQNITHQSNPIGTQSSSNRHVNDVSIPRSYITDLPIDRSTNRINIVRQHIDTNHIPANIASISDNSFGSNVDNITLISSEQNSSFLDSILKCLCCCVLNPVK